MTNFRWMKKKHNNNEPFEYFLLCSVEEIKSYSFETTRVWVNNNSILHFEWIVLFIISGFLHTNLLYNFRRLIYTLKTVYTFMVLLLCICFWGLEPWSSLPYIEWKRAAWTFYQISSFASHWKTSFIPFLNNMRANKDVSINYEII